MKDTSCAPWAGTAVSDLQYKLFPFTHIRTRANVTWTPDDSLPFPIGGLEVFRLSGTGLVDLFEANGCVATVTPNNVAIEPLNGQMVIDRTQVPNVVSGSGSTFIMGNVTDCQGNSQLVPIGIMFLPEQTLPLNEKGDELVASIVVDDNISFRMTLDILFKRVQ